MTSSVELNHLEETVARLRELHAAAADDHRMQTARLLGLAIADLAPRLPEDDFRQAELADEGLARLDESGDSSPAAEQARTRLTRIGAARQGPDTFRIAGGDLNWDVNWAEMLGPSEAARNLLGMLPMLAASVPPMMPLRQALLDIAEVIGAFDRGQWSPEGDAVLASAIRQVELAGLGNELGSMLRVIAMMIRMKRCQIAEQEGRKPTWPALAELDVLVTDASAWDVADVFAAGPFQQAAGLEQIWVAGVITMRILADIKSPRAVRDRAWRDTLLRLVDQAKGCLARAPSGHAEPVQLMRGNLDKVSATLRQMTVREGPVQATPVQTAPAPAPPPAAKPAEEPLAGIVTDPPDPPSWRLDESFSQLLSPQGAAAFLALTQFADSAMLTAIARLTAVYQAVLARRWTPDAEHELDALSQEASRLNGDAGASLHDRATVCAMLAMARVGRWGLRSQDPRPAVYPSASETAELVAEIDEALQLLSSAQAEDPAASMYKTLEAPLRMQAASLLTDLGRPGGEHPDPALIALARKYLDQVPPEVFEQLPPIVSDALLLQGIVADGSRPTSDQAELLARRFPEVVETTGIQLDEAEAASSVARQRRDLESVGAALNELNKAAIALPAGSPHHVRRLLLQAEMQTLLARHSSSQVALADVLGVTIDAGRATREPAARKSVAHRLATTFAMMTLAGLRDGPFDEAQEVLDVILAEAAGDDWPLRVITTVATGAVLAMRAFTAADPGLHESSRTLVTDAERLLPEPRPDGDWYGAARTLHSWACVHTLSCPDACLLPVALRVGDVLAGLLASNPEMISAEELQRESKALREAREKLLALTGPAETVPTDEQPPPPLSAQDAVLLARDGLDRFSALLGRNQSRGPRRLPLAVDGRPAAAALRHVSEDLHTALATLFTSSDLRRQVDEALGRCAAELYWADPGARTMDTLRDAIVHLNRTLSAGARNLPVADRAEVLYLLARCRREVALRHGNEAERAEARAEADRATRASVRELARCVLLTSEPDRALEVATLASEVVARGIGWCLADGNERAAVELAEAGRGLVLASVTLAGRVEELLRGAGLADTADQWRQGSEAGRAEALEALWHTKDGATALATPTLDEISITLATTSFDAVVYLVSPAPDDGLPQDSAAPAEHAGHAVLVRPLLSAIEVLPLPGIGRKAREPLDAYLTALDNALRSFDSAAAGPDGFRGGPDGQAWSAELVAVGGWTYDSILGPLTEHARGWNLSHRPHLALIPLGDLAAIPYAAAWTDDGPAGTRRYAIEDVTLTYAASARLLGEVSRRPRQPLGTRVVLMSDPQGRFHMTRRAGRRLASRQYREAEVYGLKSAPHGPATIDALLGALPGTDRPGASLLQVSTHGSTDPVPRLQTFDGWLPLTRILDQARSRPPDAPGGLIITNACLTDSTRTHHDESLTLATALLAAGATDVIGTRWPVDDDTATALSLRLHYHLQLGKTPPEALQSAQCDLIRAAPDILQSFGDDLCTVQAGRLRHPVSWAGYVHHGADTRAAYRIDFGWRAVIDDHSAEHEDI